MENKYTDDFLQEQLELLKKKQTDDTLEWQDIADFRADYTGELEHRDTIRKGSKLLYELINADWVICPKSNIPATASTTVDNEEFIKLRKEKIKLSDQRTELNRLIRLQARKETFLDMVKDVICSNVEPINIPIHYTLFNSECDLLVSLSDIHTGIEIDNNFNQFDKEILRQRIEKYTSDILDIRGMHIAGNCHLVIGEVLSGIIHSTLRIQNNMDLMEQFKYICELITGMLVRMANHFNNIYVYVTPGNHSRVTPKKEDSLDGENMDILVPFYLKARLQNVENIYICENKLDKEIATFEILGNTVYAAHGHKDSPSNVVQNLTLMFGKQPDIVLLGHRHLNGLTTVYDTKVLEVGCISGTDDYAVSIRKVNKPEQMVSVINKDGLLCFYDIQL